MNSTDHSCLDPMKSSLPLCSSDVTNAFDRHLYISSENDLACSILCYDSVLCYVSNVLGQSSLNEIEANVQRYFSREQCTRAYCQLHNCLDYVLAKLDAQSDQHVHELFQQCSLNLIDATLLLPTMESIHINGLASYLPCFVTDDWINMIRHVQNLEQLDTNSSMSMASIQKQMDQLKEQLTHLHRRSSATPHAPSTSKDQCCLRTCCSHDPTGMTRSATLINSPSSSSWSSLDTDFQPIASYTGFIRNAVTSFLIPTAPAPRPEMNSSVISLDDNSNNIHSSEIGRAHV